MWSCLREVYRANTIHLCCLPIGVVLRKEVSEEALATGAPQCLLPFDNGKNARWRRISTGVQDV